MITLSDYTKNALVTIRGTLEFAFTNERFPIRILDFPGAGSYETEHTYTWEDERGTDLYTTGGLFVTSGHLRFSLAFYV